MKTCRTQIAAVMLFAVLSGGCLSRTRIFNENTANVVIVNSPAEGIVSRVYVREGMTVDADYPVIEITVQSSQPAASGNRSESPQARAAKNYEGVKEKVEKARREVVQAEVEVQRLTPLVASGAAPQAQLDAAQATLAAAKQRFEMAQAEVQNAQAGLVRAQSQPDNTSLPIIAEEKKIYAYSGSPGTIGVINISEGDRVRLGQPVATIRPE